MENKKSLQVLLSAMHLKDASYIKGLNISGDCLIINQCDREEEQELIEERPAGGSRRVEFCCNRDRGLSKSRNLAIRKSRGDICIFCDNDVVYEEDYEDRILSAFERNPEAGVIVFFIERPERNKPVKQQEGPLGYVGAMKIFSPEIAFRREALLRAGLCMDERFGAGAEYMMGEENIFLFEAIKRGMQVIYVPEKIAHLRENESSWFKGYNEKYFISRGAGYRVMSPGFYILLILQFALRKYGLYRSDMGFFKAVRYMLEGSRQVG